MSFHDLKLLGTKASAYAWRIIWALKLKGLEYEFIEEDVCNKSSLLLEMNPVQQMIPVLIHNGKSICESLVILEYIDETWKESPFLPEDPQGRAYARFWARFAEEKQIEVSKKVFASTEEQDQARWVESMAEAFEILEREIGGRKFFGGDKVGFVDLVIGWSAYWLPICEEVAGYKVMDSTKYPHLQKWKDNFFQVPFIKENLPTSNEIFKAFGPLREKILAMASNKSQLR